VAVTAAAPAPDEPGIDGPAPSATPGPPGTPAAMPGSATCPGRLLARALLSETDELVSGYPTTTPSSGASGTPDGIESTPTTPGWGRRQLSKRATCCAQFTVQNGAQALRVW